MGYDEQWEMVALAVACLWLGLLFILSDMDYENKRRNGKGN